MFAGVSPVGGNGVSGINTGKARITSRDGIQDG